ncbi:MBL fold metallo-hydrolase [Pararhodobacter oceanensis]|uniref:MBL fold metallo-hydrolase n=1 Tax=Pararhodobacter oceanensis TaxID=2172121 RepID=UPI003A90210A
MTKLADRADMGGIRYPFETAPELGEAIEVAPGILWARMPLPMQLDHVNVFALDDGDGWSLIDTGFDTGKTRAAWTRLIEGPLGGRKINRIVITHHHPDHIGLAGWFQSEHGAELVTTRTAWLFGRMLLLDVHSAPVPETVAYWRGAGMSEEIIAQRLAEKPFNFADVVAPMPLGFTRIKEGDSIHMGGRDWHVRTGDGHAPEHATFWSEADNLVLGGDQLLPGISANLGVYPTEPDADPVSDWIASCRRLGAFATDEQLILPGHKLPFTGLPLRLRQMVENHEGALDRLEAHLAEPKTAAQCFMPLFKREIEGAAYGMALVEAVAHLNHLLVQGRVTRARNAAGAWEWQALGGNGHKASA